MQKEQMKSLIRKAQREHGTQPFQHWQFTTLANWEAELLFGIGAITEDGIVSDYPMVQIDKGAGDTELVDYGGEINQIRMAIHEFEKKRSKEKARIVFVPRKFTVFKEAMAELDREKFAQELAIKNIVANSIDF